MNRNKDKQFPVHNNVKLTSIKPETCRYAFVDSAEHHADRILMGALIPVRFEKTDTQKLSVKAGPLKSDEAASQVEAAIKLQSEIGNQNAWEVRAVIAPLSTKKDPQIQFELRICTFQSRYESWFLCCMADLEWVLQVEGDYIQACDELLGASAIIHSVLNELQVQNKEESPFVPTAGLSRLGLTPATVG